MKIILQEHTFCLVGSFTSAPNAEALRRAIIDAGGQVTKGLGATTTALVMGEGWNTKVDQALMRGLPVLTEQELNQLLRGESIERAPQAAPSGSLHALIGELRGALDGPPDGPTWDAIVAQLDRCEPEQLEPLVDYLEPILERWPRSPDARVGLQGLGDAPAPDEVRRWLDTAPWGELRVAPLAWVAQLVQGQDSPKLRLVRALHLEALGVKGSLAKIALMCPSLGPLKIVHFSDERAITLGSWDALFNAPSTRTLRRLRLSGCHDRHVKAFTRPHQLDALRELELVGWAYSFSVAGLTALYGADLTQRVEQLTVQLHTRASMSAVDVLRRDAALLPKLTQLNLALPWRGWGLVERVRQLRPCHTLGIVADLFWLDDEDLEELFAAQPRGFHCLDLTSLRVHAGARRFEPALGARLGAHAEQPLAERLATMQDGMRALLTARLPNSALVGQLAQVRLGRWWSDALADALLRQGVEPLR